MRAYKANMIPGGTTPVINVSQYDNDYAVTVTLIEGAEIYTPPAGATIRVEGTKPDGHGFEYPCTYQGNVVTMPIYTQMTAVAGRFPIELVVYQSGLRVGSCNIIFAVERAPLGEGTDISETVIPDIIAGAQAQADAAAASAVSAAASAETAEDAAAQVLSSRIVTDASGSIASFSDGADDVAVKSLVASITPVQSGSGDPSPTNIRPISGRTGMTVTACGVNVWDEEWEVGGISTTTGGNTSSDRIRSKNFISCTPNTTYSFSFPSSAHSATGDIRPIYYDKNKTFISASGWIISNTFTTPSNAYYMRFLTNTAYGTSYNHDISINYPATVTAYEPYVGHTYPITWESSAGTVYGGTLDVVSGVLTVNTAYAEFDGSDDENWSWSDANNLAFIGVSGGVVTDAVTQRNVYVQSNIFKGAPWSTRDDIGTVGMYYGASMIFVKYSGFTSVADLKAYIAEHPLQVIYKLATPQTYQLTPTEVRTILGGNTIYTDAGDVSVEYIADTKLYIDNKIAELQALVLEN